MHLVHHHHYHRPFYRGSWFLSHQVKISPAARCVTNYEYMSVQLVTAFRSKINHGACVHVACLSVYVYLSLQHGCGNILCDVSQVLSTEHAWSLDHSEDDDEGSSSSSSHHRRRRGAESACYVNSLRSGSFALKNERVETLAQGPMTVADVACAKCHRTVG